MTNTGRAIAAILALSLCAAAVAKDEGFYIGASIGAASVSHSGSNPDRGEFDIDDSDYAYKLFGGYQFSPLFAVEGGYRDLGTFSSRSARMTAEGFDVSFAAGLPLGPVRAFGKLGTIYLDSSTRILESGARRNSSGFDLAAGVGLDLELGSAAIRGEIEYLDVLDGAWMYTVGATYTF